MVFSSFWTIVNLYNAFKITWKQFSISYKLFSKSSKIPIRKYPFLYYPESWSGQKWSKNIDIIFVSKRFANKFSSYRLWNKILHNLWTLHLYLIVKNKVWTWFSIENWAIHPCNIYCSLTDVYTAVSKSGYTH